MKNFKLKFTAPTQNGTLRADYRRKGHSSTEVMKHIIKRYPGAVFTDFEEVSQRLNVLGQLS